MKILAIDTAFNACSIAFLDTISNEAYARSEELERGHAEKLVPMVDSILSDSAYTYADIDLIAVTTGPGAFTGMRIGIATAKALSLSLAKPLIGVDSFTAFYQTYRSTAESQNDSSGMVAVILETKRDGYYFTILDKYGTQNYPARYCDKDVICNAIERKNCTLLGDAVDRFLNETKSCNSEYSFVTHTLKYPDPVVLAKTAQNILGTEKHDFSVSPIYLREADVTLPKKADRYLRIL